jgi:CheY-like chemotaxis protein
MNQYTNILLAEDDVDDYLYLVEAFESISSEFKITRAGNGLECITILKTKAKPDIVFLDLNMPIKKGLECLKFIREHDRFDDVPVIIYSTSHYIKDIDAAYKGGANFYIVKPSSSENLTEILIFVMSRLTETLRQADISEFVLRIPETIEAGK